MFGSTVSSNGWAIPLEICCWTLKVKQFLVSQHKTRWANAPQEEPCEVFVLHMSKIGLGFDEGTVYGGLTGIYQTCPSGGEEARRQEE